LSNGFNIDHYEKSVMSNEFTLNAELRTDEGKAASRRLRRLEDKVPAIIYGGRKKPVAVAIQHKDFIKQLENEAFYAHVVEVVVDGKPESVILKDLQRHPSKAIIMHADFMRVSKTKKFTKTVPLHFINEDISHGVKIEGGIISHAANSVEISTLPADLPAFIEVDMAEVKSGTTLHISDLKLPKGVTSVALALGASHDLPVVSIKKLKGAPLEDGEGEGEGEEASAAE
jgi:large subunit ribosomal protein L25